MKKWLKWTLGILVVIILLIVAAALWYWPSISIIQGTEELSGDQVPIPEASTKSLDSLEAGSADWVSWYGPNGDRQSLVTGIKTDWSTGLNKQWEVNYLCQGVGSASWSAPVIRGNRLIISGRDTENDIVFCLDPDNGNLLWHSSLKTKAKTAHGSGPRATPFIDDDRVYTFGRSGDLVCLNLFDGKLLWHKSVMDEGGEEPMWGHSSSPLVLGDLVIVQGGGDVRTIAYNKYSGDVVWKSGQGLPGYAALLPMTISDKQTILAFHGDGLAALDVNSGKEIWNTDWPTDYDVNATTPLIFENKIFITSGYGTGGKMLTTDGTSVDSLWRSGTISSIHSDPYLINGFIYGYSGDSFQNKGAFKCMDPKRGEEKWSTNDMGWGTCMFVDGYLLCGDIKGNIFLMKPDPENFMMITNLEDALGDIRGPVWTVPVVANGKLYLRYKQKLVCYNIVG